MAVAIEAKIINALIARFDEVTLPAGITVVYPGYYFIPSAEPFVRLSIAKNGASTWHIGGGREPIRQGLFMAAIWWPVGSGILDASELAGLIRDHFAYNTVINHDGIRIAIVEEPRVEDDQEDDNYVQVPVIIPWMTLP